MFETFGKWISFKPCYKWITFNTNRNELMERLAKCFKPCYKWITFNTIKDNLITETRMKVLNLVINGLPSILSRVSFFYLLFYNFCFKPCYKWITFNTLSPKVRKDLEILEF